MGQLDMKVLEARRTMIQMLLTMCMTNGLKDEETDYEKVCSRNRGNKLLADNVDTIVKEEGKLNSNLKQVSQQP